MAARFLFLREKGEGVGVEFAGAKHRGDADLTGCVVRNAGEPPPFWGRAAWEKKEPGGHPPVLWIRFVSLLSLFCQNGFPEQHHVGYRQGTVTVQIPHRGKAAV